MAVYEKFVCAQGCNEFELHTLFENAADQLTKMSSQIESNTLLYFYARYKQATCGKCNTPKPGFLDFKAKQKWEAWQSLGSMTRTQAMTQYVHRLTLLQPDWHLHVIVSKNEALYTFLGVSVSRPQRCDGEETIRDGDKTAFDWCKEGNWGMVNKALLSHRVAINEADANGMCLIHWAADRGHAHLIHQLLDAHADIDIQDEEGQTALHYGTSCEHASVVQALVERRASLYIVDNDGLPAVSLTSNPHILGLLSGKAEVT